MFPFINLSNLPFKNSAIDWRIGVKTLIYNNLYIKQYFTIFAQDF